MKGLSNMTSRGIPGLLGTDHIGFTVPDIEAATEFFTEILGAELIYSLGPFEAKDDWMATQLNVHPRAVIVQNRHFRLGHGANFEIFHYETPEGQGVMPKNSDIGGHHLAFYVEDLDAAIAYLKSKGIKVLGKPVSSKGPASGQRWIYFLSPWGMQLELLTHPYGKKYETQPGTKLWTPRFPAD
ncbi:MAG TPA: VOC family protein [Aquiluna sp.]